MSAAVRVNGKLSMDAPVTVVVAALHPVCNLPPGYVEHSRWTDGQGWTTIRCWPEDAGASRMPKDAA